MKLNIKKTLIIENKWFSKKFVKDIKKIAKNVEQKYNVEQEKMVNLFGKKYDFMLVFTRLKKAQKEVK